MFKISRKSSVYLSMIIGAICFIAFLGFGIVLPFVWKNTPYLADFINGIEINNSFLTKEMFFIWLYSVILVIEICCVAVFFLLFRVKRGLVFSPLTVELIRFVSWGCLLLSVLGFMGNAFHNMMFFFALAAAFLGICLRVVKNVMEEATAIKNENDFTV